MPTKRCVISNCVSRTHGKDCDYCLKHLPDEFRCSHTTRKNKRCKLPAIPETNVCKTHIQSMERGYGKGKYGFVYVYFTGFYVENSGVYKIGRSVNPDIRLGELRSGNPFGKMLFSYFVADKAKQMEATLHKTYKEKWMEREMFILTHEDIENIRKILERESKRKY